MILTAAYLFGLDEGKKDPVAAREVLLKLGAAGPLIEEVSRIIRNTQSPGQEKALEYQCVHDAERSVTLEDDLKRDFEDLPSPPEMTGNAFFTESGRKLALEIFQKAQK